MPVPPQLRVTILLTAINWLVGWVVITGGPMNSVSKVIHNKWLSPYTFTMALLDTTDPASLLTLHLYMYSPLVSVVSVVYDVVLSLLTVIQLLPGLLLSQEYTSVPVSLALHIRVILLPSGTSPPVGWVSIDGRSVKKVYLYNVFNNINLNNKLSNKYVSIYLFMRWLNKSKSTNYTLIIVSSNCKMTFQWKTQGRIKEHYPLVKHSTVQYFKGSMIVYMLVFKLAVDRNDVSVFH